MDACFMGLGYIGLPTAIIAAKHGVKVTGVDINPKVVEMTNEGKLHIIEPGMQDILEEVVANGMLTASTIPTVRMPILWLYLHHLKEITNLIFLM
ncbi:MAG: hypothetical protein ACLS8T_28015 [Anaerobutyricum sp.]